tara:strand:- start:1154 stop:1540 length:387 start_codon:yes stop_codon:yes gene_type:complete
MVNGVTIDLTAEEEAELDAMADANDLDLTLIRGHRNGLLTHSDWSVLEDATLGDHTKAEWLTYRQALRDHMTGSDRVSTFPAMPEDPPTAKVTRKVAAGSAAHQASLDGGGTAEEAQTAYDTAYAATD